MGDIDGELQWTGQSAEPEDCERCENERFVLSLTPKCKSGKKGNRKIYDENENAWKAFTEKCWGYTVGATEFQQTTVKQMRSERIKGNHQTVFEIKNIDTAQLMMELQETGYN